MKKSSGHKSDTVLRVENLRVEFKTRKKMITVVNDISFAVRKSRTLGIIGESGCGKTVTALALMRLVPSPPGRISGGKVSLLDVDITDISEKRVRDLRGRDISMIFQEPMTSLNPAYTVGNQIAETIRRHKDRNRTEAYAEAVELLDSVQMPAPERRIREYPHQLSGGMRQRVMIAMALACEPKVLIADEPTTALDVTVQAQIFDLLKEIQASRGTSIILITHDFGAVAEMADDVIVMYAGHKVEEGTVEEIINGARHPYTQGLLRCMPEIRLNIGDKREKLMEIPGAVPDLSRPPPGCPFAPRCPDVLPECTTLPPSFVLGNGQLVKCWLIEPAVREAHESTPT